MYLFDLILVRFDLSQVFARTSQPEDFVHSIDDFGTVVRLPMVFFP